MSFSFKHMGIKGLILIIGLYHSLIFAEQHNLASQRIVTAGGSVTEIVYALGAQQSLVAVDTSSLYPQAATTLPKVGYYRQLSTEGILSMSPSHVIATSGVGPSTVVKQLEDAGVNITVIEQPKSVEGVQRLISSIGEIVDKTPQAEALNQKIKKQVDLLTSGNLTRNEKMVFLMSAGDRGLVAAGDNTVPQLIMELLKVTNPFFELDGFKPISVESLLQADPRVILMPTHQVSGRTKETLCESEELKLWAQRHGCQLYFVDSLPFLGLTPRLPDALADTVTILNNLGS